MSAQNGHDPEPIPIVELVQPLLDSAKTERADIQNHARGLRDKAHRAEDAAKARRQDLAWLDSVIKTLPQDNKRLPEYQRIRESQVGVADRLEAQAHQARGEANRVEERLKAIDLEIQLLEKGNGNPAQKTLANAPKA